MTKLFFVALISVLFVSCDDAYKHERPQYREAQNVALDDFYRKVTGFDSIQIYYFMGEWKANFCYSNKWEFDKFETIERIKSKGIIIGTQKGDLLLDNAVKKVYNK